MTAIFRRKGCDTKLQDNLQFFTASQPNSVLELEARVTVYDIQGSNIRGMRKMALLADALPRGRHE